MFGDSITSHGSLTSFFLKSLVLQGLNLVLTVYPNCARALDSSETAARTGGTVEIMLLPETYFNYEDYCVVNRTSSMELQ